MTVMRSIAIVLMLALPGAGCARQHHQLTNRQVAIGAGVVVGFALLLYLAVEQCNKGASFCDDDPPPGQ